MNLHYWLVHLHIDGEPVPSQLPDKTGKRKSTRIRRRLLSGIEFILAGLVCASRGVEGYLFCLIRWRIRVLFKSKDGRQETGDEERIDGESDADSIRLHISSLRRAGLLAALYRNHMYAVFSYSL